MRAPARSGSDPIIRVRRSILESPVRTYTCAGDGHLVTLIGTVHVGERANYDQLHARAAGLEAGGAVVQYEAVRAT